MLYAICSEKHHTQCMWIQINKKRTEYFVLTHDCGTKRSEMERSDHLTLYTEALLYDPRELECPLVAGWSGFSLQVTGKTRDATYSTLIHKILRSLSSRKDIATFQTNLLSTCLGYKIICLQNHMPIHPKQQTTHCHNNSNLNTQNTYINTTQTLYQFIFIEEWTMYALI